MDVTNLKGSGAMAEHNPGSLQEIFSRVVSLYSQGNYSSALELAREGLAYSPDNPVILNAAATCAFTLGAVDAASGYWQHAVSVQPSYADAHYNLGILYTREGRVEDAESSYQAAIQANPGHIGAHVNMGVLLHEQNRDTEAESWYNHAISMAPDHADLLYNMAALLAEQKRYAEAESSYQRVIALKPDHQGAYNNLGVLYRSLKEFIKAERAYREVLSVNPRNAGAYRNLGLLLQDLTRFDEAEQCFRQALLLDESDADARWSLGMLLLYQGRFEEGWACYESRYNPSVKGRTITPPELPFPQWRGESLVGKSILIWPEQALGDEIQTCRYAQVLKDKGAAKVTFVCKPVLKSLLQGVSGIDVLLSRDEALQLPIHDFWTLQFSLPHCCGTRMDSVPASVPYLNAKPEHIKSVRSLLKKNKGFKVGICWKGSSMYLADADRSPGLAPFSPLFSLPGIQYFSLLPGTRSEFLEYAGSAGGDLGHDIDQETPPFEETAALISELDLVISSDTSVVHVAAALGKPVWIVLPFVADWRWVHAYEGTPWYPNVRLFRQSSRGDWKEVFQRVSQRLQDIVSGKAETLWPIAAFEESTAPACVLPPIRAEGLRLNLGSGGKNLSGWVNVDFVSTCNPDVVWDLEKFPWPWENDSVDIVLLSHVLEHLGQSRDVYLGIIKELYRVCRRDAQIIIHVPHPRHDFYLIDPTHVRPITVDGMRMFDQSLNREWVENNFANTPLGIYMGVDLRVIHFDYVLAPLFQGRLDRGELSLEQISELVNTHSNVCQQINMVIKVVKEGIK